MYVGVRLLACIYPDVKRLKVRVIKMPSIMDVHINVNEQFSSIERDWSNLLTYHLLDY